MAASRRVLERQRLQAEEPGIPSEQRSMIEYPTFDPSTGLTDTVVQPKALVMGIVTSSAAVAIMRGNSPIYHRQN
jgi:hypothetical protein